MKRLNLVVLSLASLAFGPARGFCTANTQAEDIAEMKVKLEAQEEEIARLRAASTVALPGPGHEMPSSTSLLIKGAGVEAEDVNWRIRAGLSPAQAVEVAMNEKNEAAATKEAKK